MPVEYISEPAELVLAHISNFARFRSFCQVSKMLNITFVKSPVPPNPQININLGLQLPPGISPQQIPQQVQQIINHLLNQISQMIPNIVQQEIVRQSPVIGIEGRAYGGRWVEEM